jgi:hypothetical protein
MVIFKKSDVEEDTFLVFNNIYATKSSQEAVLIKVDNINAIFSAKKIMIPTSDLGEKINSKWELIQDYTFPSSLFRKFLFEEHQNLEEMSFPPLPLA